MKSHRLLDLKPRVRPELRISRPLRRGAAEVHLLWDPLGERQLEVGPKEHFVIARLDGTRTLAEIGDQYAVRFRARLGEPQWQQLLGLLHTRGLLEGSARPAPSAASLAAPAGAAADRSGMLAGRIRLVADAPALLDRLHHATGFARRPAFLVPLLALVTALLVAVAAEFGTLVDETATLARNPVALLAVGVLLWTSLALHELAHGLVGRAFGGRVGEIGLRWRLPVTYLYCEVENVRFFARRREQIATAAAGAVANLAFLLPFWPARLLLPEHAQARPFLGALLLLGTAVALGNLLPLPPLDGYKALGYALDCLQLATESRTFVLVLARATIRRDHTELRRYPTRLRLVLGGYALGCAALAITLLTAAGLLLADHYGPLVGVLPALAVLAALLLRAAGMAYRNARGPAAARAGQVT
ncbi:peptidase M50 [Kitasatospora sp. NA04385]|uniref:peptidase M50 n=1 Tax=Kitasatospora sp. NA04385 TaxID=2742135 RepID=UPI00159126CB|nr:peptidase M50 [Kitasatospora sp. NA04385]QKW18192.1 peptidase M50 [Kitasatospora sp. NA04385]